MADKFKIIILLLISFEVGVLEAMLILFISGLVEIVHVQLSYKGREVIVLEKLRKYLISEFVWLLNNKSISIFIPTYNAFILRILYFFKK